MLCRAVGSDAVNSGHYRVYLPAWSIDSYSILPDGKYGEDTRASPWRGAMIERIRPRLPIIADANEESERGDGVGDDDCSYIDAGEANIAGTRGFNGNRLSDRHYGGANYLFSDHHAERSAAMREDLARDWDLNGIDDIQILP
jgi:prepilin-type processing-associated H-X9-DG protein